MKQKEKIQIKKSIIEKGLEYYKKYELEKEVKKGLEKRFGEYKNVNNSFQEIQFNSIKN